MEVAVAYWRLLIPVAVFIPIIIAATVFAGRIEYRQYKRETAPVTVPEMSLVYIPAGEFVMGSPKTDEYRFIAGGEEPLHKVRISKGFYIGATEVTQAQYQAVMGDNPSCKGISGIRSLFRPR